VSENRSMGKLPTRSYILRNIERVSTSPLIFSYYHFLSKLRNRSSQENHPSLSYLFVLSTGRSGTQTLAALYGLSKQILAFHEPQPRLGRLAKLVYEQEAIPITPAIVEALLVARNGLFQAAQLRGKHYVEAAHYNTFLAPVIKQALPTAKFIHLVRNPVDVSISAAQRRWYAGNVDDSTRVLPRADSGSDWDKWDTVQKNAWLWAETNRWIIKYLNTLPANDQLQIHSEDVFEGNPGTIDQLYNFIGVPKPADNRIRRVLGNRLNARVGGASSTAQAEAIDKIWTISCAIAEELHYRKPSSEG
jgi:hypothetical protein